MQDWSAIEKASKELWMCIKIEYNWAQVYYFSKIEYYFNPIINKVMDWSVQQK